MIVPLVWGLGLDKFWGGFGLFFFSFFPKKSACFSFHLCPLFFFFAFTIIHKIDKFNIYELLEHLQNKKKLNHKGNINLAPMWHQCTLLLLHATCGYKFHHTCSKLLEVLLFFRVVLQSKLSPFFCSKLAHFSSIILISFQCLFFSNFCQQNLSRPTGVRIRRTPLYYGYDMICVVSHTHQWSPSKYILCSWDTGFSPLRVVLRWGLQDNPSSTP